MSPAKSHLTPNPPPDRRFWRFALLCVVALVSVLAYALYRRSATAPPSAAAVAHVATDPGALAAVRLRPHVLFRNTALGPSNGRLAVLALDALESPRLVTPLSCERAYATRERGLCLQAARGVLTTYRAVSFDGAFAETGAFDLQGTPSRTRVAPAGPYAAATVFVSGDSYAGGSFSTRTTIFDLAGGRGLGDLEQFGVTRGGSPFKQQDFNFWGVTFAPDGDRFYATLSTGGGLYLIEGRVSERTVRVLREGVECPSLSPDGGRIAFKVRAFDGGRLVWRLRILDLATGRHVDIAESRSIDDQAEWLDNDRVLYALPRGAGSGSSDVWSARADGAGSPALFISDAFSPAIVR